MPARRLVQPDLFVVPWTPHVPASWREVTSLVLAIEVVSPGTARADRQVKRRLYQDEGVAEYWIVDADARLVERWRPTDTRPALCDGSLTWAPREDVPPLTIDLGSVFGPDEPDGLPERPR
jgi:Uma2 family endonuclease